MPDDNRGFRQERYRRSYGALWPGRAGAVVATVQEVLDAARAVLVPGGTIAPGLLVAIARHEANYALNEVDDEPPGIDPPRTHGIFQISEEEARSFGHTGQDCEQLATATEVMVGLLRQMVATLAAHGYDAGSPVAPAFLVLGHNEGPGNMLRALRDYGLDWFAFAAEHPRRTVVAQGYAVDAINLSAEFAW